MNTSFDEYIDHESEKRPTPVTICDSKPLIGVATLQLSQNIDEIPERKQLEGLESTH